MNKQLFRTSLITVMLFLSGLAAASDRDCRGNCGEAGGDTVVDVVTSTGDVNASPSYSSKALGLSNSLGDVDINDCLASTQVSIILFAKQGVILNKWCSAEVYDAKGMYEMAAIMRCDIQDIRKHFTSDAECVKANTAPAPVITQAITVVPEPETQVAAVAEEIYHDEHEEEEEVVHNTLEQRLAELEAKREADARRATRYANEQKEFETEQRSYAQQALADLQEYQN